MEKKSGQWGYKGRKIAPQDKIEEILRNNNNHELAGHRGIKATLLGIRKNWTWDGIRKEIER